MFRNIKRNFEGTPLSDETISWTSSVTYIQVHTAFMI